MLHIKAVCDTCGKEEQVPYALGRGELLRRGWRLVHGTQCSEKCVRTYPMLHRVKFRRVD